MKKKIKTTRQRIGIVQGHTGVIFCIRIDDRMIRVSLNKDVSQCTIWIIYHTEI